MYHAVRSVNKVTPKSTQLCLNTSRNFGTTHFIAGYKNPQVQLSEEPKKKQQFTIDKRLPIIDGSSVHLVDEARLTQSFCTMRHDISSVVLSLLEKAQKKISVAAFSLTDARIANQLIAAHKKGIDVCVILDAGNMKQVYSKAQMLIDNGVSVWRYDPLLRPNYKKKNGYEQLMHLKWIIVDDVLINGSANLTKSAQDGENIESVTVFRCPQLVKEHRRDFKYLKTYCVACKPTVLVDNKIAAME